MKRIAALLLVLMIAPMTQGSEFGHCSGKVQAEWDEEGRHMILLTEYVYVDGLDQRWVAAEGEKINGASIPRFLWSLTGGPYEGLYRKASVPHDVECQHEREEWPRVHKMFHDHLRCSGVPSIAAKIMYAAVYHCGPRWGGDQGTRLFPCDEDAGMRLVRKLRRFLGLYPASTASQLAALRDTDLSGISGERPAWLTAEVSSGIAVREDLLGYTITLNDFAFGEEGPTGESQQLLAAVAAESEPHAVEVRVSGITDSIAEGESEVLAYLRAGNVNALLVGSELPAATVETYSLGISADRADFADARGQVEVVVRELNVPQE